MEGLEITILPYSEAISTDPTARLDPSFFEKRFLDLRQRAKSWDRLEDYAKSIVCGPFGSNLLNDNYVEHGIPMVRPFNLRRLRADQGEIALLEESFVSDSGLKIFGRGSVMFARVGEIGIGVNLYDRATISPNIIAAELNDTIDPYFIGVFANTSFGLMQLEAGMKVVAQPTISTDSIRSLRIPRLTHAFQKQISVAFNQSVVAEDLSAQLLAQAERTLLEALDLKGWQPPEPLTYVRRASNAFAEARLDAEYYAPAYDTLLDHIKEKGEIRLGDAIREPVRRGISPEYVDDGDLIVVNSQHVGKTHITLDDNRKTSKSLVNEKNHRSGFVMKSDVLLNSTGVITIGRCQCLIDDVQAVADNHVAIIRSAELLDPVYLACFLNSRPGLMQTERGYTGSSGQIELRPEVVENYLIWLAPKEIQENIRNSIEMAHSARMKSRLMLEHAKRAVEIAIEQGEAAALEYLNETGIE